MRFGKAGQVAGLFVFGCFDGNGNGNGNRNRNCNCHFHCHCHCQGDGAMRYLIIRLAALGDVAMASSLARRIRDREAGACIHWMTGRVGAQLARCFPEVDEVLEVDDLALFRGSPVARARVVAGAWRAIARGRYDRVLLAHADARYRLLTAPVRAGKVRALSREYGAMNPIPGRYLGDEFARLFDDPGHVGPIEGHWALSDPRARIGAGATRDASPPAVVLVPGGARNVLREDALRRWPAESYALVAGRLLSQGARVILVGDANDAWVRPAFAGLAVDDRIGALSIADTLRVMAQASLVIAHDTGPMHLARLVRAPLVALFGPTRPAERLVEAPEVVVLWGGAQLACRPCYDGREFAACADNRCIKSVTVDEVLAAAGAFLAGSVACA